MSLAQNKETWEIMARSWVDLVKPPSRPCPTQLKIWEKVIKTIKAKKANPKALTLGSTPEFRDLLASHGYEVTVCDLNEGMILAMEKLMHQTEKNEHYLVSNWLTTKFKEGEFDLVLGDASLNQILNLDELIKLLNKISKILSPGGYFLTREVVAVTSNKMITPEQVGNYFAARREGQLSDIELFNYLKYSSYINPCLRSPTIVDSYAVYQELLKINKKYEIKDFFNWYQDAHSNAHKYMMLLFKDHLEDLLSKDFEISPLEQCQDYHFCAMQMPAYLLKKKYDA